MICPLCKTLNNESFPINLSGSKAKNLLITCKRCGLSYLKDYLKDRTDIYNENYSVWGNVDNQGEGIVRESKIANFDYLLKNLKQSSKNKKLLDIGTGRGYLLDAARSRGFDCYGVELSKYTSKKAREKFPNKIFNGTLERANYPKSSFDIIVMTDLIEHLTNPINFFKEVKRIIKKDGIVLITTPDTDSITRRIMGKNWFQYKQEHVIYFNKKSIIFLMKKVGFNILNFKNNEKKLTLDYYSKYFKKYSSIPGKIFNGTLWILPNFLKKKSFLNPLTGEILILAKNDSK